MHKNLLSPIWTNEENIKYEKLLRSGIRMQEISNILGRSYQACYHRIETLGLRDIYEARIHSVNDNFWSIPNKINSYWAGFSMADCYIERPSKYSYRYKLELSIKDKNHLERFIKDAEFSGGYKEFQITKKIRPHQKPSFIHTVRLSITSKLWGENLEKNFNIVTKKTHTISMPNLPRPLLDSFLIGYIDGDGWITLDKNNDMCIGFVSSSELIIQSIVQYIKDNFVKNTLSTGRPINYKKRGNSYEFTINGLRATVVFDYLSQIQGLPKLERKWLQPRVLEYVSNLKLKFPHLFKTFEYNNELNSQILDDKSLEQEIKTNHLNLSNIEKSPIIV